MLSPKELASVKFDRVMGRGYKTDEVDNFLSQVIDLVRSLEDDKQELEQKMLVLADKLEEYKNDEESLRSAIIGAQKLADSVIREAKEKAQAVLDGAHAQADLLVQEAKRTIEQEENRYTKMKREVATFKSKLQMMYKQHLELISNIPSETIPKEDIREPAVQEPSRRQQESSLFDAAEEEEQQAYEQDAQFATEELPPLEAEDTQEYDSTDGYDDPQEYDSSQSIKFPSTRQEVAAGPVSSRFGPLKFGKEFDIKRDGRRKK